jgi:long-chain acyl-CoA synthetase
MLFEAFTRTVGTLLSSSGIRLNGQLHPYGALAERSERLASGLLNFGIGVGDPVAILMRNSPDFFALVQALFAVGAIAVPLDVQANAAEIARAVEPLNIRAFVASADLKALAEQLATGAGVDLPVIIAEADGSFGQIEGAAVGPLPALRPDDVALYLFSSGSTGRQKVVPRTHGQLLADAKGSIPALGFRFDDLMLNILPAHHAFGFVMMFTQGPLSGASTLLWAPNQPLMLARGRLMQTISAEGVTLLPGVPFLFDLLAGVTEAPDLSKVRSAFSGAAALKRASFDLFRERFGITIRQALGTTETSLATFNNNSDPVANWDSVGTPVGDVRVELLPAEESSDPAVGELLITSSAVTKGYLNNPEANLNSFKDGGWLSGDLARMDADGNIYMVGRKKLIVAVAGQKVDPIEVEDVLMGHPAVAEAVVVGIPDPRTGEQRLKAVVVKKSEESAEALVAYVRSRLSAHKVPYIVEFIDALPRSVTGKVLRGKLIE